MFALVALVLFVAEIAAFIAVGHLIGYALAVLILVVVSLAGPVVVKRAGLGVLAHARQRLDRGEVPTREVLDGVVVLAGGLLICIPGFIGDAIGLLLMLRPVRYVVIRLAGFRLAGRIKKMRSGRWTVIDATSSSRFPEHPQGMVGPGGGTGRR